MWKFLLLNLVLALTATALDTINISETQGSYGFAVDYQNNQFLLDGQPFRYVSGSFHYFRTPRHYWRDRLRKLRAAGLNAVSTYVEWSLHQPQPDTWMWSGEADLMHFLNLAQEEGLMVLLRPGPYICAERDLGGLPYWLLNRVPDIRFRTNDQRYMGYVTVYLNEVLKKIKPLLRGQGGPIIMVQVENEYGSYSACDIQYMVSLQQLFSHHVGTDALLYTTDGALVKMLQCGVVTGAYATVDFGVYSNVTKAFEIMRIFQPRGPLVNSEFYPGWLTHWGEPFQTVGKRAVKTKLYEMLSVGASVNIYMFYGGTNFGFTSGANGGETFSPQLTSYDYDAPLTEAGDPTPKYFAIRDVIAKYLPMPNLTIPTISPKGDYGPILMESIINLFDPLARTLFGTNQITTTTLPTFESLDLPYGLVLYEAYLPQGGPDSSILHAIATDRALVYVDSHLVSTLSRTQKTSTIPLEQPYGSRIQLLLENQGHLNYGSGMEDFKGLWNVTVNGSPIPQWNVTGFRLNTVKPLRNLESTRSNHGTLNNGPVFLKGEFTIEGKPLDTFLDTTGWGKGVAYINGHNLGRYWPLAGPQMTLYVPAPYLRRGQNELILLELEFVPRTKKMTFVTVPKLGNNTET
ncbi:beta-galactosidase isoform X2 [Cephus cinctus]|uniref:Beta-galactosidase n=1 Tax=Cephus cinctus TaxID=211228 RepID=A0AAJ7FPG1_CEPCN|nr:beta-galactosidase isoform X2 [Cephus cinctus]